MKRAFVPLFLFLLVVVGGISRNYTSGESEVTDSTPNSNPIDLLDWYNTHKTRSSSLRDANKATEAIAVLDSCLNYAPRLPQTKEEKEKCGWIYVNRAYLFEAYQGNFLSAKADYLRAVELFQSVQVEDFYVARYVYQPLGNIHTRFGENEQAIRLLERFIAISYENNQIEAAMNGTNDLGRALMNKGDDKGAEAALLEGIDKCGQDFYNKGLLFSSLAEVYANSKEFKAGIDACYNSLSNFGKARKAISQEDYRYEQITRYEIGTETILGVLLTKTGDFDASEKLLNGALEKAKPIYPEKHRKLSKIYLAVGKNYAMKDAPESAVDAYHSALLSVVSGFDSKDSKSTPAYGLLTAEVSIGEALILKAQAFMESADKNEVAALASYLAYFEWVRINALEQQDLYSKLYFAAEVHQNAESALQFLLDIDSVIPADSAAKLGFAIIDQSKGMLLEESVNSLKFSRIKKDRRFEKLRNISAQIAQFRRQLKQEDDSDRKARLEQLLTELDQAQHGILSSLKSKYSGLSKSVYRYDSNKLFSQLANMESDVGVLNYFQGDSLNLAVSVINNTFAFHRIDSSVHRKIPELCAELYKPSGMAPAQFSDLSSSIYNDLIPSTFRRKTLKNLMIVPDGILHKLPFEVLVSKSVKSPSWKNLAYLVRSASISYAPSATALFRAGTGRIKPHFAGIAPSKFNSEDLPELSESIREVTHGAKIFKGKTITRSEATKNQFIEAIRKYNMVHIATHAGTQPGRIEDNWMAFHGAKGSNRLLNSELLQFQLDNELVVLNACETGSGKYFAGEGSMSLARGFLSSGSYRVITNLWLANHTSNSLIFRHFYQNLSNNSNASEALRQAKVQYLSDESTDNISAHPYYWATPILIGSSVPLDIESQEPPISILWLALILVVVLGITIYARVKMAKFIKS